MRNQPFDTSGQSMVEMALVLPFVLLCLTGLFACGITFNNWIELTEASGTAGRQLAISRGSTLDPCATTASAFYLAAPALTQANVTFSLSLNGTTYAGSSCNSGSTNSGAAGSLVQGKPIILTVNYPCSLKFFRSNLIPGCSLKSVTTEISQ